MAAPAASNGWAPPDRDPAHAAQEWSVWYADYLTRATTQSAKTLELYQRVLEHVSRGQISPNAIQEMLPAFAQTRGAEYATKLSELSSRFFVALIEVGAVYSQEQAELIVPGAPTPPPLPPFTSTDPSRWFKQLTDYATDMNARIVTAYQTHLQQVAAGEATQNRLQQASANYFATRLPEHLRHVGKLYFELLNNLSELRNTYEEDYLLGILAAAQSNNAEEAFVLHLTAPMGEVASASLSIGNTSELPTTIRCSISDMRRADGVNPSFEPRITVTPEPLELMPGVEGKLRLSMLLDETEYDFGVAYVGSVRVIENDQPGMEIPVRVLATRARGSL